MAKIVQLFIVSLVAGGIGTTPEVINPVERERELILQLKQNGNNTNALLELVTLLNEQNRGKEAVTHAKKALELLPETAEAHFQLAVSLRQKMGKSPMSWMMGTSEYTGLLKRAIVLNSSLTGPYQELIGFYTNAPFIVGGGIGKALKTAADLENIDEKAGKISRANILLSDKEVEKALVVLENLYHSYPTDSECLFTYGTALMRAKKYEKAMPLFDQGINMKGEHSSNCLYQAGKVRVVADMYLEKAVEYFDQYIAQYQEGQNPTAADALWRKGLALIKLDKKGEARASFEAALNMDPEHQLASKALNNLKKGA